MASGHSGPSDGSSKDVWIHATEIQSETEVARRGGETERERKTERAAERTHFLLMAKMEWLTGDL